MADSIGDHSPRLTTMLLRYPRCIHAEFMTHRVFSRNAASSRAIPVKKLIQDVSDDPFVPLFWGRTSRVCRPARNATRLLIPGDRTRQFSLETSRGCLANKRGWTRETTPFKYGHMLRRRRLP